ncbi:hypothetical protein F5Y13DRAFT_196737 [Hypoxylon sp. FL1857]|nr:hypothetical protein F5Y13DRAFT_196737 [Hypoxylon sp. FL1857]
MGVSKTTGSLAPKIGISEHRYHKCAQAIEQLKKQEGDKFCCLVDVHDRAPLVKDECVRKKWKVTIRGHTVILRDVLEKISVWVDKFLKFGDIAIQYDPASAALPWAAVRLIMQAAVNDVETFGYVLESIERITNVITCSSIIERHFLQPEHSEMDVFQQLSDAIVSLYIAILRYLFSILHYYSNNWVIRFVKSASVPKSEFETKFSAVETTRKTVWDFLQLAGAEKSEQIIESSGRLEIGQTLQTGQIDSCRDMLRALEESIRRMDYHTKTIHDNLERATRVEILNAISTVPYKTHHKITRKGRLKGSGQWLFQKDTYRAWHQESYSSVLWLHGIPGCGKSKLTSLVVDELEKSEHIAYFYCMRNPAEPFRSQCNKILASLVRQLAGQGTDNLILPPVVKQYEDAIAGYEGFEDHQWDSDESMKTLLAIMEFYPSVTLVLDALEEVDEQDRQELIDALKSLLRNSPNLLKIFISSRDNYDISLILEGSPNVYIDADDNAGDISAFIDDQLASARLLRGKLSDSLRKEIIETLVRGARGMFRWVDLQIQSLRPLKVAGDIKARLGVLPLTLESSYMEIYQNILSTGDHAASLANFTFQWLMYAKRALSIKAFTSLASSVFPPEIIGDFTDDQIIDICSNLIVVRGKIFEFAHLSVREFFEGINKREIDVFLPMQSHGFIATACLRYLTEHLTSSLHAAFEEVKMRSKGLPEDSWDTPILHLISDTQLEPILYASRYWILHAKNSKDLRTSEPLSDLIKTFLFDATLSKAPPAFALWCGILRTQQQGVSDDNSRSWDDLAIISEPINPIWLACINDWPEIVEFLYRARCEDIERPRVIDNFWAESGFRESGSPLLYATTKRNFPLVKCILSCTTDPMWQPMSDYFLSPLLHTAETNDPLMLSLLLQGGHGGLEVEEQAAIAAASQGSCRALEVLIRRNDRIIRASKAGYTALLKACRAGHADIATVLIDNGALIKQGETLLSLATLGNHSTCVELLLDRGIGLKGLNKALITAISQNNQMTAQLLLRHGAQKEDVAVTRSIRAGLVDSTVNLIKAGFDTKGCYFEDQRTALHYAAETGSIKIVHALLETEPPINCKDRNGQTPLHLAAARGHFACVEALLNNSADISVEDAKGMTPLDWAETKSHISAAEVIRRRLGNAE